MNDDEWKPNCTNKGAAGRVVIEMSPFKVWRRGQGVIGVGVGESDDDNKRVAHCTCTTSSCFHWISNSMILPVIMDTSFFMTTHLVKKDLRLPSILTQSSCTRTLTRVVKAVVCVVSAI